MDENTTKLSGHLLGSLGTAAVDIEAQGDGSSDGPGTAKKSSRSFTTEESSFYTG